MAAASDNIGFCPFRVRPPGERGSPRLQTGGRNAEGGADFVDGSRAAWVCPEILLDGADHSGSSQCASPAANRDSAQSHPFTPSSLVRTIWDSGSPVSNSLGAESCQFARSSNNESLREGRVVSGLRASDRRRGSNRVQHDRAPDAKWLYGEPRPERSGGPGHAAAGALGREGGCRRFRPAARGDTGGIQSGSASRGRARSADDAGWLAALARYARLHSEALSLRLEAMDLTWLVCPVFARYRPGSGAADGGAGHGCAAPHAAGVVRRGLGSGPGLLRPSPAA